MTKTGLQLKKFAHGRAYGYVATIATAQARLLDDSLSTRAIGPSVLNLIVSGDVRDPGDQSEPKRLADEWRRGVRSDPFSPDIERWWRTKLAQRVRAYRRIQRERA